MEKSISSYVIKAESVDPNYTIFFNLKNGVGIKLSKEIGKSLLQINDKSLDYVMEKYRFISEHNEDKAIIRNYTREKNLEFHLVILVHQNCNFRCTYCYEKFDKNKISIDVENAIIHLVKRRLSSGKYKYFRVDWFGGEPTLALDVIERLSKQFEQIAKSFNVKYSAGITTNGFKLNFEARKMLLQNSVTNFQITIDGIKMLHDSQRVLAGGQPTYDVIIKNLVDLAKEKYPFTCMIRMNVGPNNLKYVDEYIDNMKNLFSKDRRFVLFFHNIGHWGGKNDHNVEICSYNATEKLLEKTVESGMHAVSALIKLRPNSACYAANENSFVIGVDGLVYKCTVALYDDSNIVGKLDNDGNMHLDEDKMNLWTKSGMQDIQCRKCTLLPICQGDNCPLERIKNKKRPCPDLSLIHI